MKASTILSAYRDYLSRRAWANKGLDMLNEQKWQSIPWVATWLIGMSLADYIPGISQATAKVIVNAGFAIGFCGIAFVGITFIRVARARKRGEASPYPEIDDDKIY